MDAKSAFVCALLRAGEVSVAKRFLSRTSAHQEDTHDVEDDDGALPAKISESIILSVSKEFSNAADSIVSDEVQMARELLSLAPWSEAARREIDALDALQLSKMMGYEMLPSQLHEQRDANAIVDMILKEASDAWRRPEQVFEIAALLGIHSQEERSAINLLLASSLVLHDQYERAASYAIDMVKAGYEPAWELAQDLSQCGALDEDVRAQVLRRAAEVDLRKR